MNIHLKVQDILQEQLGLDLKSLTPDATFHNLGADSLDMVEITMTCEEEFDIDIPDAEAAKFETIYDLTNFITTQKL